MILSAPVALIFFNRPDTLKDVFAKIREVKPIKLFLIQDGARESDLNDAGKIQLCREIVGNIDWECQVYRNYSETNLGCGLRPSTGITWVFQHVESCIILEDDTVPDISFFYFCEELLEKYKDDQRVCMISGLNHFEEWPSNEYSYFFTKTGAIAAWATWRRAWTYYDHDLKMFSYQQNNTIRASIGNNRAYRRRMEIWKKTKYSRENGQILSYWDHQWGLVRHIQAQFTIVPWCNLIHNIGVGESSTHAKNIANTYQKGRNFVFIPTKEMLFPLKHPNFINYSKNYDDKLYSIVYPSRFVAVVRRIINRLIELWPTLPFQRGNQ